jgi:uncharacterized small protein (DUF1192 family)
MGRMLLVAAGLGLAVACVGGKSATWQTTCGDPSCGGHRDNGVDACDTGSTGPKEGAACTPAGAECDPGNDCNSLLDCAVDDPKAGGCPISRRAAKKDIHYLTAGELETVDARARHVRLATWRYNEEDASVRPHLGFIIDDDEDSPAVARDGGHVDLYGYDSMTLAAVQVQSERVDALQAEVDALQAEVAALKAAR